MVKRSPMRDGEHVVFSDKPSMLSFSHDGSLYVDQQNGQYIIRHLAWNDEKRQTEYQQLRAEMFVKQLEWDLLIDAKGRERDRYDVEGNTANSVHCVYGKSGEEEYLLTGLRIFQLQNWHDSMITQEFYQVGMIPSHIIESLTSQYDCTTVMEVNRMCVLRGIHYVPLENSDRFNLFVARDLVYAVIHLIAEQTERRWVVTIVYPGYLRILEKERYVFDILYSHGLEDQKHGYALVLIDIFASMQSIKLKNINRANRFLTLSVKKD